ncbi:MAG: ImmA/IrrE family metallo-endopeptidase [Pyrinomonadaceae bacterium]|nr:ImmA/IrrE family metallo-endopeptidase [Pyrinomonadaceae bacterium]
MKLLVEKIRNLRIGWNERPLTEDDFYRLCRRFKIKVTEMPLSVGGFHFRCKKQDFIALSTSLTGKERLLVMFHEFAHFLLHAPNMNETASFHGVGRKTRKEQEADRFAIVALLPLKTLETRSVDDLIEEGFDTEMLRERIEVYEKYRI